MSITMTLDGEILGPLTPRMDMVADILETPRGRREWQDFEKSAERVKCQDRISSLEEKCKVLEMEMLRNKEVYEEEVSLLKRKVIVEWYFYLFILRIRFSMI